MRHEISKWTSSYIPHAHTNGSFITIYFFHVMHSKISLFWIRTDNWSSNKWLPTVHAQIAVGIMAATQHLELPVALCSALITTGGHPDLYYIHFLPQYCHVSPADSHLPFPVLPLLASSEEFSRFHRPAISWPQTLNCKQKCHSYNYSSIIGSTTKVQVCAQSIIIIPRLPSRFPYCMQWKVE